MVQTNLANIFAKYYHWLNYEKTQTLLCCDHNLPLWHCNLAQGWQHCHTLPALNKCPRLCSLLLPDGAEMQGLQHRHSNTCYPLSPRHFVEHQNSMCFVFYVNGGAGAEPLIWGQGEESASRQNYFQEQITQKEHLLSGGWEICRVSHNSSSPKWLYLTGKEQNTLKNILRKPKRSMNPHEIHARSTRFLRLLYKQKHCQKGRESMKCGSYIPKILLVRTRLIKILSYKVSSSWKRKDDKQTKRKRERKKGWQRCSH